MKISNNLNLPEPIVAAIRANWYGGEGENRFASVTELIKPTKQLVLAKRHGSELEQDASQLLWTLMGSAIHKVVEAANIDNAIQEERLGLTFEGERITGGLDLYKDGVISDFKFTSVWSYLYGSRREEWTTQLNLYAYLLERHGFPVEGIEVVIIFRDWNKHKAQSDPLYPKPVERLVLDLWPAEKAEEYLRGRIEDIHKYSELPDDLIPECSQQERWERPDKYAVIRLDASRALRVFDHFEEALNYLNQSKNSENLQIITRTELPKRCFDYCPVNRFCHYYRSWGEKPRPQELQNVI